MGRGSYLEGRWEGKGTYVFYLELVTDLLHLCVYVVFFFIVFTNYGLPLHLVRARARRACRSRACRRNAWILLKQWTEQSYACSKLLCNHKT